MTHYALYTLHTLPPSLPLGLALAFALFCSMAIYGHCHFQLGNTVDVQSQQHENIAGDLPRQDPSTGSGLCLNEEGLPGVFGSLEDQLPGFHAAAWLILGGVDGGITRYSKPA